MSSLTIPGMDSTPTSSLGSLASTIGDIKLDEANFDGDQLRYMGEEEVILVDAQDRVVGRATKKISHLTTSIYAGMLHRAFSVFLFNSKNELLLQQRAGTKITFPHVWANTCCSHPLFVKEEMIEEGAMGVKNAAVRKLDHELGIKDIDVTDLHFLTKIKYEACQDATWGEYEVDWLMFARKDVEMSVNPNEIDSLRFVTKDDLKQMFKDAEAGKLKLSPWFQAIAERFLFQWWDRLDEILANKGLLPDMAKDLPSVTDLGVPSNGFSAAYFITGKGASASSSTSATASESDVAAQ